MNSSSLDVTVFILAGGKSTRMGTDKAFVILDGRTLLARALDLARSVTSDVRIVGHAAKFAPFAPVVEDIFPGCGPLGGIHAALRISSTDLNAILAVDVPFVPPALLQYLIKRSRDAAATVTVELSGLLNGDATANLDDISGSNIAFATANGIINPRDLQPGMIVTIPKLRP